MSTIEKHKMLHVREKVIAEFLGLKVRTLQVWRCNNFGPPYRKIGRLVMYNLDSVSEWAKNQEVNPPGFERKSK